MKTAGTVHLSNFMTYKLIAFTL